MSIVDCRRLSNQRFRPLPHKLNAAGNALAYSTYLPGNAIAAIAADSSGNLFLAGTGSIATTPGRR